MLAQALLKLSQEKGLTRDAAFTRRKVHWIIHLTEAGGYEDPLRQLTSTVRGAKGTEKEVIGAERTVPSRYHLRLDQKAKPCTTGNAGGEAYFLAEDLRGVLGIEREDGTGPRPTTLQKFEAFRQLIAECHDALPDNRVLRAIMRFYGRRADLEQARAEAAKAVQAGHRLTFRVGEDLILDDEQVRDWWRERYGLERDRVLAACERGRCLVTGALGPILPMHPPIFAHIPGGGSTGTKLASFDKEAFASFGLEEARNSPMLAEASEGYATALEFLLDEDDHHLRIGKAATACFWVEGGGFPFRSFLRDPDPRAVRDLLTSPYGGREQPLQDHAVFRSLVLSANQSRIVVRSWFETSLQQAVGHLRRWFQDTALRDPDGTARYFPLRRLLQAIVRQSEEPEARSVSQIYATALSGAPPPPQLLASALRRQKLDQAKKPPFHEQRLQARTSLVRLCLNRAEGGESMPASLDDSSKNPGYLCGRILQVLDSIHYAAHGGSSQSSPADRYYASASATPALVFPRLCKLARYHLDKIDVKGKRIALDRDLTDLLGRLGQVSGGEFPVALDLNDQGRFALGFYHERSLRLAHKQEGQHASQEDRRP